MTTETRVSIVEATPAARAVHRLGDADRLPLAAGARLLGLHARRRRGVQAALPGGARHDGAAPLGALLARSSSPRWTAGRRRRCAATSSTSSAGPTLRAAGIEANRKTGRTEEEAAAGFERAKSIMNVLPEHPPGAWIVENVATLPEFRRRGLVDRLMEEIPGARPQPRRDGGGHQRVHRKRPGAARVREVRVRDRRGEAGPGIRGRRTGRRGRARCGERCSAAPTEPP